MKVSDYRWQIDSRDIWHGTKCLEHCLRVSMAVKAEEPEALAKVTHHVESGESKFRKAQGNEYETWVFEQLSKNLGKAFVELAPFADPSETIEMAELGRIAIAQAPLRSEFDDFDFNGRADLLLRSDYELSIASDGTLTAIQRESYDSNTHFAIWEVKHKKYDPAKTKQSDIENYLNQLAMNYEALNRVGLASSREVGIIFRDLKTATFEPEPLLAALRESRKPMFELLASVPPQALSQLAVAEWNCGKPSKCGDAFCEYPEICQMTRIENDDLSQLHNLDRTHGPKYLQNGFDTVAKVLAGETLITKINPDQLAKHKRQAAVIVESKSIGAPVYRVFSAPTEGDTALPPASPEDLAVDFEWYTPLNSDEFNYVFGVMARNGQREQFVAADASEELAKFEEFLTFVETAISRDANMHIYIASTTEVTKTRKLGERYGINPTRIEAVVDRYFDLIATARNSIVVSTAGFGLKSLESFFISEKRDTDTTDGANSLWMYHEYLVNQAAGNEAEADAILKDILEYNMQDCVSTMGLYDWLATL